MTLVAAKHLRIGDRVLEPGDTFDPEPGRNDKLMVRLGQATVLAEPAQPVKRGPGRPRKDSYE